MPSMTSRIWPKSRPRRRKRWRSSRTTKGRPRVTDLQLTVIGCSAAMPRPGGACSSYLVTYGAVNVLMDCGPDSLAILRGRINPRNLDAIVISHLHADHTLDLVPLAYGLKYGPPVG